MFFLKPGILMVKTGKEEIARTLRSYHLTHLSMPERRKNFMKWDVREGMYLQKPLGDLKELDVGCGRRKLSF